MNELNNLPTPLVIASPFPMTSTIAAEFVTSLMVGESRNFLVKYGQDKVNWVAVAKLICAVANVLCPIVSNL